MKNIFYIVLSIFIFTCKSSLNAQTIVTVAGSNDTSLGDGGNANNSSLLGPYDIAIDPSGNLLIADGYHHRIRKVSSAGVITTIAGTGVGGFNGDNILATAAQINFPIGIISDGLGNIYFCDELNNRVRKIGTTGVISTIAGNGVAGFNGDDIQATSAELFAPHCVALDSTGNFYITDCDNHRIRKINSLGQITTIAGNGIAGNTGDNGPADSAEINKPYGIALDGSGNIFFSDYMENVVRKIDHSTVISTFAGGGVLLGDGGPADSARLSNPACITFDNFGDLYIADIDQNRIRKVTSGTGVISTVAGNGTLGFSGDNGPATNAELAVPTGVAIDATNNLYVSDFGNGRVRYIDNSTYLQDVQKLDNRVTIYPNPSQGIFSTYIRSLHGEQATVFIYNSAGDELLKTTSSTNVPIEIKCELSTGVYYLTAILSGKKLNAIIMINK